MYRVHRNGEARRGAPRVYGGVGGAVARAVDAFLSPFAPGAVLRRQKARIQSAALLNYDAASRSRLRRPQQSSSADGDLLNDLPTMRRNSRAMVRDDSAAAALVRVLEDNIVGTGLQPQMNVRGDVAGFTDQQADDYNRSVEQVFAEAAKQIDASENDSFADLQRQVLRSVVVEGEALLHRIYIDPLESQVSRLIGTAYELIDVDLLEGPVDGDRDIRGGVELGPRSNAVAYWILPRHPDEWLVNHRNDQLRTNLPQRHPRYAGGQPSILHIFRRDRAHQTRGVPFFAPCFGLVEAMNDMLETELQAARAASKFCAFIKQSMDENQLGDFEQDADGEYIETLESGTIRYLNEGEEIVPYTPNRPGTTFEPFVVRVMRSICAAIGLPYELVMKDFGRMNYSSARVSLLEARRGFEVLQQLLVEKLCEPVFRSVVIDAVLAGHVRMPRGFLANPSPFLQAYWQPPAWGWVDPVKEVEASTRAVQSNLSTPQAEAARQGGDAESILRQRARHLRKAREIEREFELPAGALTQIPNPTPQAEEPADDENEPEEEAEEAATE